MSRMTVLEIVQNILSSTSSDEVNSIDDTIDAQQVADALKASYLALSTNRNWPSQHKIISFEANGSASNPTRVKIADNVKEITFVSYNTAQKQHGNRVIMTELKYMEPDNFLRYTNGRNSINPNVSTVFDPSGVRLFIINNQSPVYYTSFDDEHITFDGYDSSVDDTIQTSKIQAMGFVYPEFLLQDDFIPQLPAEAMSLLLEETRSRCSLILKQEADQKAEQESQRQQRWLSRKAFKVDGGIRFANYGRSGKGYSNYPYRDPTFRRDR